MSYSVKLCRNLCETVQESDSRADPVIHHTPPTHTRGKQLPTQTPSVQTGQCTGQSRPARQVDMACVKQAVRLGAFPKKNRHSETHTHTHTHVCHRTLCPRGLDAPFQGDCRVRCWTFSACAPPPLPPSHTQRQGVPPVFTRNGGYPPNGDSWQTAGHSGRIEGAPQRRWPCHVPACRVGPGAGRECGVCLDLLSRWPSQGHNAAAPVPRAGQACSGRGLWDAACTRPCDPLVCAPIVWGGKSMVNEPQPTQRGPVRRRSDVRRIGGSPSVPRVLRPMPVPHGRSPNAACHIRCGRGHGAQGTAAPPPPGPSEGNAAPKRCGTPATPPCDPEQ